MAAASGRRAFLNRAGGVLYQPLGTHDTAPAAAASLHFTLCRGTAICLYHLAHGDEPARPLSHRGAGFPGAQARLFLPVQARQSAVLDTELASLRPSRAFARFPGASDAQRRHYARSRRRGALWHRLRDSSRGRVGFPWSLAVAGAGAIVMLPALVPLVAGGAFAWVAYVVGNNIYRSVRKHLTPPGQESYPPPAERPFRISTAKDVLSGPPASFISPFLVPVLSWATMFFSQGGAAMDAAKAVHSEAVRLLKTRAEPQVSRILGAQVTYGSVRSTSLSATNVNGIERNLSHISFPVFSSSRAVPVASVDVHARWKTDRGGEPVVELTKISFFLSDGVERTINVRDLGIEENEHRRVFEGEYREIKE